MKHDVPHPQSDGKLNNDSLSSLEHGCTKRTVIDRLGREQEMKFISEGNLYRLIVRSQLPSAEKFEKWVFDEVLPTIRKTGSYNQPMSMEDIIYQMSETKRIKQRQIEQQQQLDTVTTRLDGMKS